MRRAIQDYVAVIIPFKFRQSFSYIYFSLFISCKNGAKFANGQAKIRLLCMQNYTWNLNSIPACIDEGIFFSFTIVSYPSN